MTEVLLCVHDERPGVCPEGCTEVDAICEMMQGRLLNSADLDKLPTPEAVVDGLLHLNSVAWLQGRPGSAKSFVALDMAACVSLGIPWQGYATKPLYVLYVAGEGSAGLGQRVRAWEAAMGRKLESTLEFLPMSVQANSEREWQALILLATGWPHSMIILDTQARLTVGMEENSAKDMGVWVRQLERLREETKALVVVVHHQGRVGEHMRGSTAMEGAADTIIQVSKEDDEVSVKCLKQKDAAPFDDIALRLVPYEASAVLMLHDGSRRPGEGPSPAAMKTARAWAEHHGGDWVTASKLVDVIAPKSTFYRNVQELDRAGIVQIDRNGRYPMYRLCADLEQL